MIRVTLEGKTPEGHGVIPAEPESLTLIRCPKQTENGNDGLVVVMKMGPATIIATCTLWEFLNAAKAIEKAAKDA